MKNLMRAGAVLALAFGLGACGSKGSEAIAKMKSFKNSMCACKDKACAEKVTKDMSDWQEKNASKYKDYKPSESEMKEAASISEELSKCTMKLMMPEGGG